MGELKPLAELAKKVETRWPTACTSLDLGKVSFLNIHLPGTKVSPEYLVVVEHRPVQGFGVTAYIPIPTAQPPYGTGPDEIFTTLDEATARVLELLGTKAPTTKEG